jgi:hypothetical protein
LVGYSGTPLPQKLGIKPGARLGLSNAPDGFVETLGELPAGVKPTRVRRAKAAFDVLIAFFDGEEGFEAQLPQLEHALRPNVGLWIAWPKKASGVPTDMTEDVVRRHALPRGLVDNKVCAIDATWSGLRLVVRLENRPKPAKK